MRASTVSIEPELESWLLEHLDSDSEALGEGYQAEVRRLSLPDGEEVVVKSPRRSAATSMIARRAIRREREVYRLLEGINGIPRAHGLIDGDRLVLDFVEGTSLRVKATQLSDRESFFTRLLETIQAMHAAGVAHGDLKRKENILVGPGEQPYIVDFGIARLRDGGLLDRHLFDTIRQLDLNAWVKLKHGRRPVGLPADDAAIFRPLLLERVARAIRALWQKFTLRRPRQKWRQRRRKAERGEDGGSS